MIRDVVEEKVPLLGCTWRGPDLVGNQPGDK